MSAAKLPKPRTDVMWLVGPQGSGKTQFAVAKIAEYKARGLLACYAGDPFAAKPLLSQRMQAGDVITIRRRTGYARTLDRARLDLLMVEMEEEPGPYSRRFCTGDLVVRFPLQAPAAPTEGWARRVLGWLRGRVVNAAGSAP